MKTAACLIYVHQINTCINDTTMAPPFSTLEANIKSHLASRGKKEKVEAAEIRCQMEVAVIKRTRKFGWH